MTRTIDTRRIGDLEIHDTTFRSSVQWILERMTEGSGGTLCTPNVDYVVRAHRDGSFRAAVMSCDLRVPDGMWVVYASRIAGRGLRETVTGRKLVPAVVHGAAEQRHSIALFGARDGVAQLAAQRLCAKYPGAVIAAHSPPDHFVVGSDDDSAAVQALQASDPRVIFVALGAPKQELWMAQHRADFPNAVLVGVGAALDILSGRRREAPGWMTRSGFEWLFRLAQEPRRLAKRYLVDDLWIFWWALRVRMSA